MKSNEDYVKIQAGGITMKLNSIYFKEEDRSILRCFFISNIEWIGNNDLLDYENIQTFGDMYENFIDENGLRDNDILMLFLAEIRYNQLVCKITKESLKMRVAKMGRPVSDQGISIKNDVISKWYQESKVIHHILPSDKTQLDTSIELSTSQNALERRESQSEAAKKIVK